MNQLWIVGQLRKGAQWEFVGVFDQESLADAACVNSEMFVAPAILNETTPVETVSWPGCYFPRYEETGQTVFSENP